MIVSLIFNVMFGTITTFIIERFQIIQGLHLYNTIGAPIVIYVASDLMQLYIYRQLISGISVALDEAALLDGCSYSEIASELKITEKSVDNALMRTRRKLKAALPKLF